jgi:hypothetical protein
MGNEMESNPSEYKWLTLNVEVFPDYALVDWSGATQRWDLPPHLKTQGAAGASQTFAYAWVLFLGTLFQIPEYQVTIALIGIAEAGPPISPVSSWAFTFTNPIAL